MITQRTAQIEFYGGRSRTAALAWGQQGTWDLFQDWLPEVKPFFVLTRWLPVPLLMSLEEVFEQIGEILNRHEALCTLYRAPARGQASQEVLASGTLSVEVIDRAADDPVSFTDIVTGCLQRFSSRAFEHGEELPVRFAVATQDNIPILVVFAVSHLSADYTSAEILVAELSALLQARVKRQDPPPPRPALQPVDLATFEGSPAGQLLTVDAMHHMRAQLARMSQGMLPARRAPESPRFFRGELESDAIPVALRAAARRYRTTTSVLLLAITTSLLRPFLPGPFYPLDVMHSNRTTPDLFFTVTSLNQAVLCAVDLTATSFKDLLAQSDSVMTRARQHARYDQRAAARVFRGAADARGAAFDPGGQFNDMWSTLPRPAGPVATTPQALAQLARSTTFSWPQKTEAEGVALFLDTRGTAQRIELSLMADTAVLAPAEIRAILETFEQVAIALAGGDVTLDAVAGLLDEHLSAQRPTASTP
ncbi:condensation domain-containing protein [Actinoplanes sp. TFC3]|uniref:condensation domain-containing protein n=1 Tax=Actinoplanes sp. TFC3 TaxID=1710355 RepID=UPI00082F608E|nr:condensation domain-containing protein [Actinoplanes sp. TFC3]